MLVERHVEVAARQRKRRSRSVSSRMRAPGDVLKRTAGTPISEYPQQGSSNPASVARQSECDGEIERNHPMYRSSPQERDKEQWFSKAVASIERVAP
jgi:hypothetical protein